MLLLKKNVKHDSSNIFYERLKIKFLQNWIFMRKITISHSLIQPYFNFVVIQKRIIVDT